MQNDDDELDELEKFMKENQRGIMMEKKKKVADIIL